MSASYQYSYDRQGNTLSDGENQYRYDSRNHLTEIETVDGGIQKNRYNGEGLRAELEENGELTRFLYSGRDVVAEQDEKNNTVRYIRGLELLSSDCECARTYYHYASDELGSITHVTDENGTVLNRYVYDAFGNHTVREETVQNRFGFTGEICDGLTGQYYLRARFYNPVIGRFLNEDTYYGDGLNLYSYCRNNPVRYVDPSGHDACPQKSGDIKGNGEGNKVPKTLEAIEKAIKENGLTKEKFLELMQKQASELSPQDAKIMEKIRNVVPMPNINTQLQKVLNPNYINGYLDGSFTNFNNGKISGCISTVEAAEGLTTPQAAFYGLRLDYEDTPFKPTDNSVTAIRFTSDDAGNIKIPYGDTMPNPAGGNVSNMTAPFTGNGFTAATNGQIIPEFYSDGLTLKSGASMVQITNEGKTVFIAVYDEDAGKFIPVQ